MTDYVIVSTTSQILRWFGFRCAMHAVASFVGSRDPLLLSPGAFLVIFGDFWRPLPCTQGDLAS